MTATWWKDLLEWRLLRIGETDMEIEVTYNKQAMNPPGTPFFDNLSFGNLSSSSPFDGKQPQQRNSFSRRSISVDSFQGFTFEVRCIPVSDLNGKVSTWEDIWQTSAGDGRTVSTTAVCQPTNESLLGSSARSAAVVLSEGAPTVVETTPRRSQSASTRGLQKQPSAVSFCPAPRTPSSPPGLLAINRDKGDELSMSLCSSRVAQLHPVGLQRRGLYVCVISVCQTAHYVRGRDASRDYSCLYWFPFKTLNSPTFVRCLHRSDANLTLNVMRLDNDVTVPSFVLESSVGTTTRASVDGVERGRALSIETPYGCATPLQQSFFVTGLRGRPLASQEFEHRCRLIALVPGGLFGDGGAIPMSGFQVSRASFDASLLNLSATGTGGSGKPQLERVIPAGETSITFEGLLADTMYHCEVVAVETVPLLEGVQPGELSPSRRKSDTRAFPNDDDDDDVRCIDELNQSPIPTLDPSTWECSPLSPGRGTRRTMTMSPHSPVTPGRSTNASPKCRRIYGVRSAPSYVATLPRVVALVESLTPNSALLSITRNSGDFSNSVRVRELLSPAQRLALLPTGGADEEVAVVARIAKRRMAHLMSMHRGSTGSRTSRSHSIGSVQRPESVASGADNDDFGNSFQSSNFEGSDESSDLSSSDEEEDEDSDIDDVHNDIASPNKGDNKSESFNSSRNESHSNTPGSSKHKEKEEEEKPKRETGDILIVGLVSPDAPFVVEGLAPTSAYSIHFYTYRITDEELEEYKLQKAAAKEKEGGEQHEEHHLHENDMFTQRSAYEVEKNRYIGRSLIVTPGLQRPVITAAGADAHSNTSSGSKRKPSLNLNGTGTSQIGVGADEGFIQNDVASGPQQAGKDEKLGLASPRPVGEKSGGILSPNHNDDMSPRNKSDRYDGTQQSVNADSPTNRQNDSVIWPDSTKQDATISIVKAVFKETNPCVDLSIRNVTDNGGEICFATDFKRTADRLIYRRQPLDALENVPQYILEQITRSDIMAIANQSRKQVKFVYCLRLLVLPRGEFTKDASTFASAESSLPVPQLSWEEFDLMLRRPSYRVTKEHKIRFKCRYKTHGLPLLPPEVNESDLQECTFDGSFSGFDALKSPGNPPGGKNPSSFRVAGGAALSTGALEQLQRNTSHLSAFDRVKDAIDNSLHGTPVERGTHVAKESKRDLPGDDLLSPHTSKQQKPAQLAAAPGGGSLLQEAFSPLSGNKKSPAAAAQPSGEDYVEATVLEFVFSCSHSKFKLPQLAADTRYLLSICGVHPPSKPHDFEQQLAAHRAAVEEVEKRRAAREASRLERRARAKSARQKHEGELSEGPLIGQPSLASYLRKGDEFECTADEIGDRCEQFTISSSSDIDDGDDHDADPIEPLPVFGPSISWKQWSPAVPFMTNYVPKEIKVEYVSGEGFRFDLNDKLCEVELRNCGNDHSAITHIVGAHTQQMQQKFVSAELTCLDDARYSRSILIEKDPRLDVYEFQYPLKFDGRYQLRVRMGEQPTNNPSALDALAKKKSKKKISIEASPQVGGSVSPQNGAVSTTPQQQADDLEDLLKFGPFGPTLNFVMCYGNVVDTEEMERGLRCYVHPPYLAGHKTESSMRARKPKLRPEELGLGVSGRPSSFVLTNKRSDVETIDQPHGLEPMPVPSIGVKHAFHITQVCAYAVVGCTSTGVYYSAPIPEAELKSQVVLLRSLRPDSYNVSVRFFVVTTEPLPAWRFGGRIQQNPQRQRSRSATFEQPTIPPPQQSVGRNRSGSLSSIGETRLELDGSLVHHDNQVIALGRRSTLAALGPKSPAPTRLSAVMHLRMQAEEDGAQTIKESIAKKASERANPLVQKLVNAFHTALRNSARYDIGTGTVYRRHEMVPLRVGEHFITLTAAVSAYAIFDLLQEGGNKKECSFVSSTRTPASGNLSKDDGVDELNSFLTASQQLMFNSKFTNLMSADKPFKKQADEEAEEDDTVEVVQHEETGGTGEVLLGMHECPFNDFAEPVFSRRGKPLRYPTLQPDVNLSKLTVTQESRMNRFLNEYFDDMEKLQLQEAVQTMNLSQLGVTQRIATTTSAVSANESESANASIADVHVGQPGGGGGGGQQTVPQNLQTAGVAQAAMAELAAQLLKKGDVSSNLQTFKKEIGTVQCELTLASERTTKRARIFSFTPQLASSLTIPNLEPGTEYRLRMRVQGKYSSALGTTPNWSRWTLPIRFTTQEKMIVSSSNATESSISLRWVREKSFGDAADVMSASGTSTTFSGVGDKSGHKKSKIITMDARVTSGIVDNRKYVPIAPPGEEQVGETKTNQQKKVNMTGYLTSLYANTLPFEVEVSLIDNSDLGSSPSRRGAQHQRKRRGEGQIIQQCRIFIPPFLQGIRLKDCYPGMKYMIRVRTTTNRECDQLLSNQQQQYLAQSPAVTSLTPVTSIQATPSSTFGAGALLNPTDASSASRKRRSSAQVTIQRSLLMRDDSPMGPGQWSARIQVSTLSDVIVSILRLGASYCSFRIDKLAADVTALRKEIEETQGASEFNDDVLRAEELAMKGGMQSPQALMPLVLSPSGNKVSSPQKGGSGDASHFLLLSRMSQYEVRFRPATNWISEFDTLVTTNSVTATNHDPEDTPLCARTSPADFTDAEGDTGPAGFSNSNTVVQWRRPTTTSVDEGADVIGQAKAGPVGDPSAPLREVTMESLKPATMYVLSIRPTIVGQFSGQWVEMVRFCTPEVPIAQLSMLCEDQIMFRWTEPILRHIAILNQDSARALERMEAEDRLNSSASISSASITSPRKKDDKGADDSSSAADSSSICSSSMVIDDIKSKQSLHPPVPFEVSCVQIEVSGRFCDPSQRSPKDHSLGTLKDSSQPHTLSRTLDIKQRLRERLTWKLLQERNQGNKRKAKHHHDKKGSRHTDKRLDTLEKLAPTFSTNDQVTPFFAVTAYVENETKPEGDESTRKTFDGPVCLALQLLLENLFPDEPYTVRVRYCDQHGKWSPFSPPKFFVTQPPLGAAVIGNGESYSLLRTFRVPRCSETLPCLKLLRDYLLVEKDKLAILQRAKEVLSSRLTLIERYGDDADFEDEESDSHVDDEEFLSKDQLITELDLISFEAGKLQSCSTCPVSVTTQNAGILREVEGLYKDLLAKVNRKAHRASLTSAAKNILSSPDDDVALPPALRRGSKKKVDKTAFSLLQPSRDGPDLADLLELDEKLPMFDDARLFDPQNFSVEVCVVPKDAVTLNDSNTTQAQRPSRQFLFGRVNQISTLSAFDPSDGGDDGSRHEGSTAEEQQALVKRESSDLVSVARLAPARTYYAVTRVHAAVTNADDDVGDFLNDLMSAKQQDDAPTEGKESSFDKKGSAAQARGATGDVEPLFTERKCCAFFDPTIEVLGFSCGMWSDVLEFSTLPPIMVTCKIASFSELLLEVYRPRFVGDAPPDPSASDDDTVAEEALLRGSKFVASASRNSTSNTFQLAVNGKHTSLRDLQSFYKGEIKLVHVYKLPHDAAVTISCRSRFSLDDFLKELEKFPETIHTARTLLRPETMAKRKSIVFWSNWTTLITNVRTLPPRPSIPVIYEARNMPDTNFHSEGGIQSLESKWSEYLSFWWSVRVDPVNRYPVEIQLDNDIENFERRRNGHSGSHTTTETTFHALPTTFLMQQSKLTNVLLDDFNTELTQQQNNMKLIAAKYNYSDVVSLADPRGMNALADPLFGPVTHDKPSDDISIDEDKSTFTGLAYEGSESDYSFEVEMAEFWPDLKCYSQFYSVGRFKGSFLRLRLPRGDAVTSHPMRRPSAVENCLFRVRSRVEATSAPNQCVRSLWSPVIGWKRPPAPPCVYNTKIETFPAEELAIVSFLFPTAPFHNQIVYEVMTRESEAPQVPSASSVGSISKVRPFRETSVTLSNLKPNKFHHVAVRVATTFGRSEWSPWHSFRLEKNLSQRRLQVVQGHFTGMLNSTATNEDELPQDFQARLMCSEWDATPAWAFPFPLSSATDGFPCPKPSNFHFSFDVVERAMRRRDPEQTVLLDPLPVFVAAGYIKEQQERQQADDLLAMQYAIDEVSEVDSSDEAADTDVQPMLVLDTEKSAADALYSEGSTQPQVSTMTRSSSTLDDSLMDAVRLRSPVPPMRNDTEVLLTTKRSRVVMIHDVSSAVAVATVPPPPLPPLTEVQQQAPATSSSNTMTVVPELFELPSGQPTMPTASSSSKQPTQPLAASTTAKRSSKGPPAELTVADFLKQVLPPKPQQPPQAPAASGGAEVRMVALQATPPPKSKSSAKGPLTPSPPPSSTRGLHPTADSIFGAEDPFATLKLMTNVVLPTGRRKYEAFRSPRTAQQKNTSASKSPRRN